MLHKLLQSSTKRIGLKQFSSSIKNGLDSKFTVVLGSQWGDEGKGKLVDILAKDYSICARFNGGANAGHTVKAQGHKFAFHLLPCGILYDSCVNVLGNGVVMDFKGLFEELAQLDKAGIDYKNRLLISNRAHITTAYQIEADGKAEEEKGKDFLGTTKKGIGPSYSSKMLRISLRVGDLTELPWQEFVSKFNKFTDRFCKLHSNVTVDKEKELQSLKQTRERLIRDKMVVDTVQYLNNQIIQNKKRVLAEGANATMLDIDFGTYPYVTSSNTSVGSVFTGLGVSPKRIDTTIGVVKAYTTRVGEGPFPSECLDDIGTYLQKTGAEFGATTGRPRRCGWLDLNVVKFSNILNGLDSINITKLDVLDGIETIKLITHYENEKGERIDGYMPGGIQDLGKMKIVGKEMKGWKGKKTSDVKHYDDLPKEAKDYIEAIEKEVKIPVSWIGVGPDRDAMIKKQK